MERCIGRGAFSECWLATHEITKCKVAIKKVPRSADMKMLAREISVWFQLDHPNIIHLYEVIPLHDYVYLAMEHAEGGELFALLTHYSTGLPTRQVLDVFRQLCEAVNYMNAKGIANRDLKLENIFLERDNKTIKIGDFGFSLQKQGHGLCEEWLGSPEYSAPEILNNKPYDPCKADCWSLGVVLFTLLTGYLPFSGVEDDCRGLHDVERKIKHRVINGLYEIPRNVSEELRGVIKGLLCENPDTRWTAARVLNLPIFKELYNSMKVRGEPKLLLQRLSISDLKGVQDCNDDNSHQFPGPSVALQRILTRSAQEYNNTASNLLGYIHGQASTLTSPEMIELRIEEEPKSSAVAWVKRLDFLGWNKRNGDGPEYKNVQVSSRSEASECESRSS